MIINIDGRDCVCEKGEFLLEVAERNGIFIPRFCHHPGLPGQASCRVCIVEVEARGYRQVVTSCVYPVDGEMTVYTKSDRIKKQRAMVLALLCARAPESDRAAAMLKFAGASAPERFSRIADEKCIMCGLCARACASVGAGAISTVGRGTDKKVATPYEAPSEDCIGCGSCAAVCPTSAIDCAQDEDTRTIWGKSFALVKCERCGQVAGTSEEIAFAAGKSGIDKSGVRPATLCEACRKKAIADAMAVTYSR